MAETPVTPAPVPVTGVIHADERPLDFQATNYAPVAVSPPFPADADEIAGHLKGLDNAIGTLQGFDQDAQDTITAIGVLLADLRVPLASSIYGSGWTILDEEAGTVRTVMPNRNGSCQVAEFGGAGRSRVVFNVRDRASHAVTCRVYADGVLVGSEVSDGSGTDQTVTVTFTGTTPRTWVVQVQSGTAGGEYRWNSCILFRT